MKKQNEVRRQVCVHIVAEEFVSILNVYDL